MNAAVGPAELVALVCGALLALTWGLYPLLVALVARLRPAPATAAVDRSPRDDAALPAVSVVVATREDLASVAARVADLLASDYPAHRLGVVVARDPACGWGAADAPVLQDPRVRVVDGDAPGGKTATLNAGVRAADGEVLAFTDTQQRFAPDALRRLVGALQADRRLGAVSGALQLPGDLTGRRSPAERYWQYERWLRANEARVHSTVGVSGSIYALRRACWAPLPAHLILDDVYVPMRAVLGGWRVGFDPQAHATDLRRTEPEHEYRRKVRTLTGNIQLCAWLPAVLVPGRNPIWLQFVCHKLLRLLTPYLLVGALAGGAVAVARRLPPAALLAVLGAGAAALALMTLRPVLRRRLAGLARWGWALQAAVVVATVNGLRGRWDVWSR